MNSGFFSSSVLESLIKGYTHSLGVLSKSKKAWKRLPFESSEKKQDWYYLN
jgi:hypothetical protein